jgi:lycopene beta-cyclase
MEGGPGRGNDRPKRTEKTWVNEKFQYLALMGLCLIGTLPLEFRFGARVYRRPRELFMAMLVPFVAFNVVNEIAVNRELWRYSTRFTTGVRLPRHYPIEEVVFFIAVPLCALLTFEAASNVYAGLVRSPLGRVVRRPLQLWTRPEERGQQGLASRSVSFQRFLSGLLLASSGLLLLFELWLHRSRFSSVTMAGDGLLRSIDWDVPEYPVMAVGLLAGVSFLELRFWRTGVFRLRAYWSTMAICIGFMFVVNGWLTKASAPIVVYSRDEFSGLRPIWDIPLEDFGFGIALLTLVLMSWVRTVGLGRESVGRESSGRDVSEISQQSDSA